MKNLFYLFVLFLTLSCSNNDGGQPTNNVSTPIISILIGKNSISNPSTPLENSLISNQSQWDALLTALNVVNNVSETFTETNINFTEFDVIAVFRNPISNSTSTVDIISIDENQNNRIVTVQNLKNGDSQDVAQPFHIVKIAKSTKPIVFQ